MSKHWESLKEEVINKFAYISRFFTLVFIWRFLVNVSGLAETLAFVFSRAASEAGSLTHCLSKETCTFSDYWRK